MSVIVVTGAAGFVGQNLVRSLNQCGYSNIILVDTLSKKNYYKNLEKLEYIDFLNFEKGLDCLAHSISLYKEIAAVFHIGANADVLIDNCNTMMEMNFEHSKFWFGVARDRNIPFIYASSSAVYGNNTSFKVRIEDEMPHNEYAFSKLAFDNYIRGQIENISNKVIGYRFFNVFGSGEEHKAKNASLPHRFFRLVIENGFIDLFDREILRDYISVEDICEVLLISWQSDIKSGIYNLGSANSISHKDLSDVVVETMMLENLIMGEKHDYIKKIPMPENLIHRFQYFTNAEDLLPWIADIAKGNEEKIINYIKLLCRKEKNDSSK